MKKIIFIVGLLFLFFNDFSQNVHNPISGQGWSNTNGIGNSVIEQMVGTLFDRSNSFTSLSFGTTNGSGQTNTATSNMIILKSDGTVRGSRSFDLDSLKGRNGNGRTDMEHWRFEVHAFCPVKSSVTRLDIGLRSQISALFNNVIAELDMSTGGNAGKLLLYTSTNTLVETSSSALSITAGDSVALIVKRDGSKIYVSAQNLTTVSTQLTMTPFTFFFQNGGLLNDVPNMGKFAIFNVSDSTKVYSINITSEEEQFPAVACITDSKGYLYVGPYERTWVWQLQHAYGSVVRNGGSSETAGDALARIDEYTGTTGIRPRSFLISVGRNGGLTDTTNYIALVTALKAAGFHVIHFIEGYDPTWASGGTADTFIAFIYRRYAGDDIIDGYTPIKNCADCLATDAVHYNGHGADVEYLQVIKSNLITRGIPTKSLFGNVDSATIPFGAGPQSSVTSSQKFKYSDVGGFYLNNSFLIENNQNAGSVWTFRNNTAGSSSSAQLAVASDANSLEMWAQSSLSAAYGAATSHAGVFYNFGNPAVILCDNGPLLITTNGNTERMRINIGGEVQIGSTTDQGAFTLQNTGGLYQNGGVTLKGIVASTGTPTVFMHQADSSASQMTIANLAAAIATSLSIGSGTYTPTLTNTTNVASSTAFVCQYLQVGLTVTVSGEVTIDPTTTGTLTLLDMSLPVPTTFVASGDCGGTAVSQSVGEAPIQIQAHSSGSTVVFRWTCTDSGSQTIFFHFTYKLASS